MSYRRQKSYCCRSWAVRRVHVFPSSPEGAINSFSVPIIILINRAEHGYIPSTKHPLHYVTHVSHLMLMIRVTTSPLSHDMMLLLPIHSTSSYASGGADCPDSLQNGPPSGRHCPARITSKGRVVLAVIAELCARLYLLLLLYYLPVK